MVKVEAVVIRERVETVIDAVEEETGHVGVTVIEAVGHGRQRGITHEYRGRVFESRFLPKALLVFVVEDLPTESWSRRSLTRPAAVTSPATASSGRSRPGRHAQQNGCAAGGGGGQMKTADLLIAANTIWVVVTAVLVMFMQAGFAFLEAGLTRMKNAGHIAGKNVLIFGDLLARLLGGRLRPCLRRRERRSSARRASSRRSSALPAVGAGAVQLFAEIPARAGYLFEVVFAGVSLAIVWGAMAERAKLWVYFVFGAVFTLIYSVISHWIWSPHGWLFKQRHAGLRRLDRRALPGRACRARGGAPARAADRQVRHRRPGEPDPGPQHPLRRPRHDHPLVRLVRLQPGLDALGRDCGGVRLLRLRRADDEPRRRGGRARRASSPPGSC